MTKESNLNNNIKLCECGCGTELIRRKWWRPSWSPRFIKGHHLKGDRSRNYRGGNYEDHGYDCIYTPYHPFAPKNGYVRVHRLVMEKHIGRYLLPAEHIHHKDGNKKNNDISNLQIISNSEHQNITHIMDFSNYKCSECGSNKTIIEKNGRPHWYYNDLGNPLCKNCYKRKIRRDKKSITN